MKITVISNLFPPHVIGGYELGCVGLARAAQTAGHQVRVLTSAPLGRLRKRAASDDLCVVPLFKPIYHYESLLSGVPSQGNFAEFGGIESGNSLALYNDLLSNRPDAIWIFNPLGLGPVGILETSVASGVPTTIHLMDHLDQTVFDHQVGFNVISRWIRAKQRMGAIACSRKTLNRNQIYGEFRNTAIIANGVPMDTPGTRAAVAEPADCIRLVYFGQVERHKGLLQLLQATKLFRDRAKRRLELHIMGSGSQAFRPSSTPLSTGSRCATTSNCMASAILPRWKPNWLKCTLRYSH